MEILRMPIEKAGMGGMKKPSVNPKPTAGAKQPTAGGVKKVTTPRQTSSSKMPAGAIYWGKKPLPKNRASWTSAQGTVYLLPKGAGAGAQQPTQPQQAQPQVGYNPNQPQQLPQPQAQQLPQQQAQQLPQQQLTEDKVRQMYPQLPRPDLVKVALPKDMNWYQMKDLYVELIQAKKNLQKFKMQLEEKYPGKADDLINQANHLLQSFDDKFGVENMTSAGRPTRGKPKEQTSYGDFENVVKQYESKIVGNQPVSKEETLDYTKAKSQLDKRDDNVRNILQKNDEQLNQERRNKYMTDFQAQLDSGKVPFEKRQKAVPIPKINLTKQQQDTDIDTFIQTRYSTETKKYTMQDVENNNKKVIDRFTKLNKIGFPKNSQTDYLRGTISFNYDSNTLKSIQQTLKNNYGANVNEYVNLEQGAIGGKTTLRIKKIDGIDWSIKPVPKTTLLTSIDTVSNLYNKDLSSGKRAGYKFMVGENTLLQNDPDAPDQNYLVFIQGGQRSGKGLTFATMINQAMASANGSIVKFFNFDCTGNFWNKMTEANPNIINNLKTKNMLGYNGVVKDIRTLDPHMQAEAVKSYIGNLAEQYNKVLGERTALLEKYNANNINDIPDIQIPQMVFNIDEAELLEGIMLTNPELNKDKEALNNFAGILGMSTTTGSKLGITMNVALQTRFQSDELKAIASKGGNTLLTLDGKADIGTFGRVQGMTRAIRSASISNARVLTVGVQNQDPKSFSPIIPGKGTAQAIGQPNKSVATQKTPTQKPTKVPTQATNTSNATHTKKTTLSGKKPKVKEFKPKKTSAEKAPKQKPIKVPNKHKPKKKPIKKKR